MKLNLDLHVHSKFSGDSPVEPHEYARTMKEMKEDYDLSGFVLMEHNHFIGPDECDLSEISKEHGLVILAGVEVDTYWGHLLVYGMTDSLWARIEETGARKQEPVALAKGLRAAPGSGDLAGAGGVPREPGPLHPRLRAGRRRAVRGADVGHARPRPRTRQLRGQDD